MRTPKRHNGDLPLTNIFAQRHSRWKRKNHIAQLKRTITRLTNEVLDLHRIIFRLKNHK